jgi:hypothetical protein
MPMDTTESWNTVPYSLIVWAPSIPANASAAAAKRRRETSWICSSL